MIQWNKLLSFSLVCQDCWNGYVAGVSAGCYYSVVSVFWQSVIKSAKIQLRWLFRCYSFQTPKAPVYMGNIKVHDSTITALVRRGCQKKASLYKESFAKLHMNKLQNFWNNVLWRNLSIVKSSHFYLYVTFFKQQKLNQCFTDTLICQGSKY